MPAIEVLIADFCFRKHIINMYGGKMSGIDEVRVIIQSTVYWEEHFTESAMFCWFLCFSWIKSDSHSHHGLGNNPRTAQKVEHQSEQMEQELFVYSANQRLLRS